MFFVMGVEREEDVCSCMQGKGFLLLRTLI